MALAQAAAAADTVGWQRRYWRGRLRLEVAADCGKCIPSHPLTTHHRAERRRGGPSPTSGPSQEEDRKRHRYRSADATPRRVRRGRPAPAAANDNRARVGAQRPRACLRNRLGPCDTPTHPSSHPPITHLRREAPQRPARLGEAVAKTVARRGGALGSCQSEVSRNHGFFSSSSWANRPLWAVEIEALESPSRCDCFCYEVRPPSSTTYYVL